MNRKLDKTEFEKIRDAAAIGMRNMVRDLDVLVNELEQGRVIECWLRICAVAAEEGRLKRANTRTMIEIAQRHDIRLEAVRTGAACVIENADFDLFNFLRTLQEDLYRAYRKRQHITLSGVGALNAFKGWRSAEHNTPSFEMILRVAKLLGWQFFWRGPKEEWPHYRTILTAQERAGILSHRTKQRKLKKEDIAA